MMLMSGEIESSQASRLKILGSRLLPLQKSARTCETSFYIKSEDLTNKPAKAKLIHKL